MIIPPWLAQATGAQQFANNPANGYQPTIGDALQGIGHSMMQYQRARAGLNGQAPGAAAIPGVPAVPGPPAAVPGVPAIPPVVQLHVPSIAPPQVNFKPMPAISVGALANSLFK